jgi:hypothetical protein
MPFWQSALLGGVNAAGNAGNSFLRGGF